MIKALSLFPGLTCLFLGCVFLFIFRSSRIRQETKEQNYTSRTWGRLVDTGSRTEYDYDNRSHTVHYGIYEFDTAAGKHISGASDFGYSELEKVPGGQDEAVEICYNPNNPSEFFLPEEQAITNATLPSFKKVGNILTVLGILLTLAAIAYMAGAFDWIKWQ